MWRRRNKQEQPISQPVLYDTTIDEQYLETIPEVESLRSQRSSVARGLPALPFRSILSRKNDHNAVDRTSSIYSQGSPRFADEDQHVTDVSPPSTPRSATDSTSEPPLISPIDQNNESKTQLPKRIPIPVKTTENKKKKEETKWDVYSGEPTTSEKGKKSTVRPGELPLEIQYPQLKERTRQILAGLRDRDPKTRLNIRSPPIGQDTDAKSLVEQDLENIVRKPIKSPLIQQELDNTIRNPIKSPEQELDNPIQRPAWKGASGRTALVEPVKSTPNPPIRMASRNTEDLNSDAFNEKDMNTIRMSPSQESIKPIPPLKLNIRLASPTSNENQSDTPTQSPQSVETLTHVINEDKNTEIEHNVGIEDEKKKAYQPEPTGLHREMESTPSWTTYESHDSPRSFYEESPDPSVSPLIIPRKRPIPNERAMTHPYSNDLARKSDASLLIRKPISSHTDRSTSRVASDSWTKSLPPTPTELEATDKVSGLEARLADLARRKRNNRKITQELSNDLNKNGIAYGMKRRKEIEKKIINLKLELDETTQEEHEFGLQLHRVLRKRDKEASYEEPTGLWIKRVTT